MNCLDRHLRGPRRNKAAIVWEGEPGDRRVLTYWDLAREVSRCGNALKRLGVRRGDRVGIYLPMMPEAAIAMLACARIGAVHSVVFGGFSAESLRDRINDAGAVALITADGGYRRGQIQPLKRMADAAMAEAPSVKHCLVVRRVGDESGASMTDGRDHWWHELLERESAVCQAEAMDAEDMLFILYTSGTTGKPKGIVHTTGGYLTHVTSTAKHVFDLTDDDVFWCTADVGWVTGHSYIVYGPLANGATVLMYEGAPDWPERDRFWRIVATYGVTILYTAPTAIRAFMKWGTEHPDRHDLSTLRLLGSVGEPINPEAWIWYSRHIGRERCPIMDTWWQTETGGIMITPLPSLVFTKPGSATFRIPGSRPSWWTARANGSSWAVASSRSPTRGRACCARSSVTTTAIVRSTGADSPAAISPATARNWTKTATAGFSDGWTTCSTWPVTGSVPWRWKARWSITRRSPRRRWWDGRTSSRARRWRPS